MPIIKSAIKKMHQDIKRTEHNMKIKNNLKGLIKNMHRTPSVEIYQSVASSLDKAVKTKFIHPNKAARLKSRLSKLIIANPAKNSSPKSKTASTASV